MRNEIGSSISGLGSAVTYALRACSVRCSWVGGPRPRWGLQGVAVGDHWLLVALRGHLGGTCRQTVAAVGVSRRAASSCTDLPRVLVPAVSPVGRQIPWELGRRVMRRIHLRRERLPTFAHRRRPNRRRQARQRHGRQERGFVQPEPAAWAMIGMSSVVPYIRITVGVPSPSTSMWLARCTVTC